jgi:peptide/nickel transport system substrate-binding protein
MVRSLALSLFLVLAVGVVPLVTSAAHAQEGGGDRPVLRLAGDTGDLQSLDPHFAVGGLDRPIVDMVFNGLIRYQPGNLAQLEPDLAEAIPEPEMVDGKQTWTFTLRQGVMCQPSPATDAYELTADDVVYSLEKAANSETSGFAADYEGMTIEKVDDYTVTITQDPPLSPTLFLPKVANYAGGFIVCSKAVEAMGLDAFKTHPVGTGPFMFQSYTPQYSVELIANDAYWRGAPKLGGVSARFIPDPSSRELGIQSGELDAAVGLYDEQWVQRMGAIDNVSVDVFGVGEVAFICFNVTAGPLDDPRVREAIAYAISRDEHLALYGESIAENVYSVVPAQYMPGGLTREEAEAAGVLFEQDVERATQLLAEAGYPDGFEMDLIASEMETYRANYEVLQAELAQVGITINLNVVNHATMQTQIRQDVNPIVIYIAYRPNADAYLTQFFDSESIVVTGAKPVSNFSHYDKIDELIEAARNETDPGKQIDLWKQANTRTLQDVAVYPLNDRKFVWVRRSNVDYGHELQSTAALYPQITELTTIAH